MDDFSIFGQIYQFQLFETTKNYHDKLNKHHLTLFNAFQNFTEFTAHLPGLVFGLSLLKIIQFYDLNDPKSIIEQ